MSKEVNSDNDGTHTSNAKRRSLFDADTRVRADSKRTINVDNRIVEENISAFGQGDITHD